MIGLSQTIQYRIWLPRPSLEYFLNCKKSFRFSSVRYNWCRLKVNETCEPTLSSRLIFQGGSLANRLPYISRFFYFKIITFTIIWRNSNEPHGSQSWGIRQKDLWKEIFRSTEINRHSFWQVGSFKYRSFFPSTLLFFNVNWTQRVGFIIVLNSLSSPYGISCPFQFHNLWHAWNHQHWLFRIWLISLFMVMMELQFLQGVSL